MRDQRLRFAGLGCMEQGTPVRFLWCCGARATSPTDDLDGEDTPGLKTLRITWPLGVWIQRTFTDPDFRSGPFQLLNRW